MAENTLTPVTLRLLFAQLFGATTVETAHIVRRGAEHVSAWEQLEQEFAIDHAQMQTRLEALEQERVELLCGLVNRGEGAKRRLIVLARSPEEENRV